MRSAAHATLIDVAKLNGLVVEARQLAMAGGQCSAAVVAIHPDLARNVSQLRFYPFIAPRTKTIVLRGEHRVVVCFGKEEEARAFMSHSQGEMVRAG